MTSLKYGVYLLRRDQHGTTQPEECALVIGLFAQCSFRDHYAFLGVIWTLRANAKNARSEHQRQFDTKRTTLQRILAAEFRNYSRALKNNLKATTPDCELVSVGRVRQLLSESLVTDLRLLEPDEIDVVVNAIISMDGMDRFLENMSQEQSDTRFLFPVTAWGDYCKIASTTSDALDFAIQSLELAADV